jgi:MFS family permease
VLGVANGDWLARIPAVKHALHLSDGLLGVALLAGPAGLVVVVLLAGRLVDRAGSRIPTLLAGPAVAVLPIGLGLAPNVAVLMAALFALGVAGGLLDVAMNAQAVLVERGYGRPLLTSFHACYSFGALAGALLGGLFAWAAISPAGNFAVVGLPLAACALLAGRWLLPDARARRASRPRGCAVPERAASGGLGGGVRPPDEHGVGGSGGLVSAPQKSTARWSLPIIVLGLLAFCSLLCEGSADGWSAVYLRDNLGTSAALAALGYAAFAVTMALGRLAGDRLAARFGPAALVRGGGLLAAAGLAGALLSGGPAGAVAGLAVFGAGLSCTFPQLISAAGNVDPARPGNGIARVAGAGYVGMLAGPVAIGGLASAFGLSVALGLPVLLALCVAAGAGQLAAGRRRRPAR